MAVYDRPLGATRTASPGGSAFQNHRNGIGRRRVQHAPAMPEPRCGPTQRSRASHEAGRNRFALFLSRATPMPTTNSTFPGWGAGHLGVVAGEGRIYATRGWISVDRGSKATLPLTMPDRVFKSSVKDSTHRPFGILIQGWPPRRVRRGGSDLRHVPMGVPERPYRGSGYSRWAQAPLL